MKAKFLVKSVSLDPSTNLAIMVLENEDISSQITTTKSLRDRIDIPISSDEIDVAKIGGAIMHQIKLHSQQRSVYNPDVDSMLIITREQFISMGEPNIGRTITIDISIEKVT